MRIVGGALRGRTLRARPGAGTRPTAERVREALASALEARGRIEGASVLDLFAGTGALGFEALSRGAESAVLVDVDRKAVAEMKRDAADFGLSSQVKVLELDLLAARRADTALAKAPYAPFGLVFADAPYALTGACVELLARLAACQVIVSGATVVVEHAGRTPVMRPEGFAELAAYRYGDTGVVLWETIAPPAET